MIDTTSDNPVSDAPQEQYVDPIVQLFLEDFAVTTLLRQGRALKTVELIAAAQGLSLSRTAVQDALRGSERLVQADREWNLAIRLSRAGMTRDERDRQTLEATAAELLLAVAKPLPLPVIVREMSFLRGTLPPNFSELLRGMLDSAHWAVSTGPDTYLHQSFLLVPYAPTEELIVRSNELEYDPDFEELRTLELPERTGDYTQDALTLIRTADRPLTHKQLGYLLWRQNPQSFDPAAAALAVGDRTHFYSFVGGWIAPLEQVTALRNYVQVWAQEYAGNAAANIDIAELLRQRSAMNAVPARLLPDELIEELKELSRRAAGQPLSLATVMIDLLEMDLDDPTFVPTLQSLNEKLRGDAAFLLVGIGRFLLRETVPDHVGEIPEILRPVHISVLDPETREPRDFEMTDEGLDGDAADFVHAPEWDDLGEEAEVKWTRGATDSLNHTQITVLNHHHRSGTLKLRRMDEEFFDIQGAFTRLDFTTDTGKRLESWASRDSGLIYIGEWLTENTPISGGVLSIGPDGQNYHLKIDSPDPLTFIDQARGETLIEMREAARYLSLYELLQNIMRDHPEEGAELATIWAEVNVVRRTSKRLMASVLSGYHCFNVKQRGPEQFLWQLEPAKIEQGFKRNKRRFIRR